MENKAIIIGGGLAGCEAAYQLAENGIKVTIYEMRPQVMTPAHSSGNLGELVCSSSLKSNSEDTAHGLLKSEMRQFGSVILNCAEKTSVPGGDALCVDRDKFSELVTKTLEAHPNITIDRTEITEIPSDRPCIVSTGPLTSESLTSDIIKLTGAHNLHFFDAIAPSVDADSIDYNIVFRQSRYDKGEAAYLNCPMDKEEYYAFIDALVNAEKTPLHLKEEQDPTYYEGCLPIEVMASRGIETPAYGTMKPVGLLNPHTSSRPYAVVQLRQENEECSVYGLVGFQTQLRISEQERVFRLIPGLENSKFTRYGQVHRNTFIDSPNLLNATLECKTQPGLFFAGQLVGVEGYMESAASGIVAGINAFRFITGEPLMVLPKETMLGSILDYIANAEIKDFQPMNSNFGVLPPILEKHKKQMRKELKVIRAIAAMDEVMGLASHTVETPNLGV